MMNDYDPNLTLEEALKLFYKENYFDQSSYHSTFEYWQIGPIKWYFYNHPQRRSSIFYHDVHHILTGYLPNWTGEGEIAAFEMTTGFTSKYWMRYIYDSTTLFIGLVISPIRVLKSIRKSFGKTNLYKLGLSKEEIRKKTIRDLREALEI